MTSFDSREISRIHHELHAHLPSEPALRTKALESLLTEKKLIDAEAVDAWIDMYRDEIGPKRGARVVARAWTDPAFRERLLANATAAIAEFGFAGHGTGHLQAVENTPTVHNLIVCTLCSCYPFSLLGMSPTWYKSNELCAIHAAFSRSSASRSTTRRKCGSGTRPRNGAISWCRYGRKASTIGARTRSPDWLRAIR